MQLGFTPGQASLLIERGKPLPIAFTIPELDWSGYDVRAQIRLYAGAPTSVATFGVTNLTFDAAALDGLGETVFRAELTSAQTRAIDLNPDLAGKPTRAVWALSATSPSGTTMTVIEGPVILKEEVSP